MTVITGGGAKVPNKMLGKPKPIYLHYYHPPLRARDGGQMNPICNAPPYPPSHPS